MADFSPAGASTLSEKIRTIILETRRRQAGEETYVDNLAFLESMIAPSLRNLREAEKNLAIHSELLSTINQHTPELIALFLSRFSNTEMIDNKEKLTIIEKEFSDLLFNFMEKILRLGVTGESPCYDPTIITKNCATVVKLCEILKNTKINSGEA